MESEAERTRLAELHAANMERALGRKQMELEIAEKLIEIASDSLGIDLKKTFGTQLSSGSGSTEKPMGSR